MKKFMFFALASAAMLASCSSDDTIALDETNVAQASQDGPVAIQIGMGGVAYTRGTGTVGGVETANNWAGQQFNLYMLKKDANGTLTMNLATKNNTDAEADSIAAGKFGCAIYNNAVFNAPATAAGNVATEAKAADGSVKYYPATGEYDFFAYRLDSAETDKPAMTATDITVPFTIDGSQDILVAKAIPADPTSVTVPYYSARAARKGVQPQMTFKHLLSRLTFRVAPGNSTTASTVTFDTAGVTTDLAVHITGIKVKSAINGTLTVAATSDVDGDSQKIAWGTAATDSAFVSVQQRNTAAGTTANDPLIAFTDSTLSGKWTGSVAFTSESSVAIGEALLVAPQATNYSMIVEGYQWVKIGTDYEKRTFELPLDIKCKSTAEPTVALPFLAGTSYNVQIVVYGLEKIEVYVTLTPWDEVTLDPIGQDL